MAVSSPQSGRFLLARVSTDPELLPQVQELGVRGALQHPQVLCGAPAAGPSLGPFTSVRVPAGDTALLPAPALTGVKGLAFSTHTVKNVLGPLLCAAGFTAEEQTVRKERQEQQ